MSAEPAEVKLAIVGYREYTDYEQFKKHVDDYTKELKISEIVSGGCRGTDQMGERYAKEKGYRILVFTPEWGKYPWKSKGKLAYTMRDKQIAEYCTHMIAFPSTKGKGTQLTIKFAQQAGKQVNVVFVS